MDSSRRTGSSRRTDSNPATGNRPPPGYGPAPGYGPPGYAYRRTNSKAGWALGLGIAGFVLCPLTGVAALILGRQAKEEIRRTGEDGEGMATAGFVLGIILCVLMAIGVLFVIAAVAVAPDSGY